MSRVLLIAHRNYLHSPVDDLESCFWVSVWSVFFNKDNEGHRSVEERDIQDNLTKTYKDGAMHYVSMLRLRGGEHSNITHRFRPVLLDWWKRVRDRPVAWVDEVVGNAPENAGKEYYLPYFHRFALEGVLDVLQVLESHWDGGIGWESWTPPAPSV